MENKLHIPSDPDQAALQLAALQFAALGSEQRLAVIKCLVRAGPEGLTIGLLGQRSGVSGSTLTHHMKILAEAGLVQQEKQGRSILCVAANYEIMETLSQYLLSQCCADRQAREGDRHDGSKA